VTILRRLQATASDAELARLRLPRSGNGPGRFPASTVSRQSGRRHPAHDRRACPTISRCRTTKAGTSGGDGVDSNWIRVHLLREDAASSVVRRQSPRRIRMEDDE
jgi:hypothetical protein